MIRKTCVSGLFYKSNEDLLRQNIKSMLDKVDDNSIYQNKIIKSVIVPHAGYIYSGQTAAYAFKNMCLNDIPDSVIIIGPNHTGLCSSKISLTNSNKWSTPLGDIDVDVDFLDELNNINDNANYDESAHIREHSIEVELPFIQYISSIRKKDIKITPIIISYQEEKICTQLAKNIYQTTKKQNKKTIVIASTDLTHYEDAQTANYLDNKIIKSIENMNTKQLIKDINEYDITMCGYGPTITAIEYAKLENANNSIKLNYKNSGDTSGDYESVVGYTSAIITK